MKKTRQARGTCVVRNRDHLIELIRIVSTARDHVEVVVPFFDLDSVRALLEALPAKRKLSFTFAWPAEPNDAGAISPEALALLVERHHEVLFVPSDDKHDRLHGKVYLVDEATTLVSSANLTARGLGLRSPANAEVGFLSDKPKLVEDVRAWVDDLSRHRLTAAALEELESWVQDGGPRPASPGANIPIDREVVLTALRRAKRQGVVREYEHLPKGLGRNAFRVRVRGVRTWLRLRARVSEAELLRDGPGYHFELTRNDLKHQDLSGFIFVPVDDARGLMPDMHVPVLFLPFDRVIGRGRNKIKKQRLRSGSRGGRRLSLEQSEDDDGWVLRAKKKLIDTGGCLNQTEAFKDYFR